MIDEKDYKDLIKVPEIKPLSCFGCYFKSEGNYAECLFNSESSEVLGEKNCSSLGTIYKIKEKTKKKKIKFKI